MDEGSQGRLVIFARRFSWAVLAAALTFGAAGLILSLVGPLRGGWLLVEVSGATPLAFARLLGATTSFLIAGAMLVLRSALDMIRRGQPFGPVVHRRMRQASFLMLTGAIISVGGPMVMELVTVLDGRGPASFGISGSDAVWVVSAASFYLTSALIERAAEFENDSRQIV